MAEVSKAAAPQPTTAETMSNTRTRVYIGGLGEGVTEEDLKKTFSRLGIVEAIDVVRSKGRSFAYINFLPSSDKSLMKLFSMYNGCSWKGGKLRLEKAKEHYLDRMRREWAEDAELARNEENNDSDAHKAAASLAKPKTTVSLAKPKKDLDSDKTQIRIFFPKLKKMKSLPYSGTGKHKYSFQHIQVPLGPVHVCGCCDEYSAPSRSAKASYICNPNLQGGGIHEEEIDMMQSVMSKLFEREYGSMTVGRSPNRSSERDVRHSNLPVQGDKADDDEEEEEKEDDKDEEEDDKDEEEVEVVEEEDKDDDLIINVVGGHRKTSLLESWTQETSLTNELTGSNKERSHDDLPRENHTLSHNKKVPDSKEKRKAAPTAKNTELVSPMKRTKLQTKSHQSEEHINSSIDEREPASTQGNMNPASMQKSSWKNLVGDVDNNTFRLSILKPNNLSNDKEPTEPVLESLSDNKEQESANNLDETDRCPVKDEPSEKISPSGKPSIGSSWLQKCPWTQLVGNGSCSFSLTQILPKQESQRSDGNSSKDVYSNKFDAMKQKKSSVGGGINIVSELQNEAEGCLIAPKSSVAYQDKRKQKRQLDIRNTANLEDKVAGDDGPSTTAPTEKRSGEPTQASSTIDADDEICPFMRTADSVKAWKHAKAALSKKKNK